MILKFSKKILTKEWKKLLLPFLSVFLTGVVVATSYFLISSANDFLNSKNKEFLGGDIVFEKNEDFEIENLVGDVVVDKISKQINFNSLLSNTDSKSIKTVGANIEVIDDNFPLYGKYILKDSEYSPLKVNEIYIDANIAKSLNVQAGDKLIFNTQSLTIKDIIVEDPESLLSGFNFLGKVLLNKITIEAKGIDLSLFRKEYQVKVSVKEKLREQEIEFIKDNSKIQNVRVRFEASGNSGLEFALETLQRFLVLVVLIIAILALVNIYASINYLSKSLRRDFAILISIGMNIKNIYKILFLVNLFVISIATMLGLLGGYYLTSLIVFYVKNKFDLILHLNTNNLELISVFLSLVLTSIFATIPVLNQMRRISPKELLNHSNIKNIKNTKVSNVLDVFVAILPITLFSMYFLGSVFYGFLVVLGIVAIYGVIMIFYYYLVDILYEYRGRFHFSFKMVLAQKKFDGFFGLVAFSSLFVALLAVYNLSIIRTSLDQYLKQDLKRSLPSVYVLDVQNSQKDELLNNFPQITLFPNVRARIIKIDDTDVLEELAKEEVKIDRELGREFNLTYRESLLPSEKVDSGAFDMQNVGGVSIEKDFAKRANLEINSKITFLIQGFEINSTITSIREVDSRSGYPFFYFILPPSEIAKFPTTFFGYANIDDNENSNLTNYLTQKAPNVSIINTSSITKIAEDIINLFLIIILIITIPPLVLSALLISTLLASVSKERKRDGARLMALGKTMKFVRNYYIIESISTTVFASIFAYVLSLVISNFVIVNYLKIDSIVYFDSISFYIFLLILLILISVSLFTWKGGGKSLKEYLNYEENN